MKNIKLSVIIPAYNEEQLIEKTLGIVLRFLKKKKYDWEVIVVDDGSTDNTSDLVNKLAKKENRLRLIKLSTNKGKGAALREGFLSAKGKYQIFTDADLSVGIDNVDRFLEGFKKRSDVVIASRRVSGATIEVHQPWHREKMGQVYTLLTSTVMGMNLKDYTCGMKGFSKSASNKVFSKAVVDRWAYDSEILYLAKKYGYEIKQVPIKWENRGETRVQLKNVIFESFRDLLSIRVNDILGKYNIDK